MKLAHSSHDTNERTQVELKEFEYQQTLAINERFKIIVPIVKIMFSFRAIILYFGLLTAFTRVNILDSFLKSLYLDLLNNIGLGISITFNIAAVIAILRMNKLLTGKSFSLGVITKKYEERDCHNISSNINSDGTDPCDEEY